MNLKREGHQKGLTVVEYVIGAASLVILAWLIFSGIATALINKFLSIVAGI
ncbi:hypothetical protein VTO7225_02288 [Vibrio toranzoniae]|jgi:hypothetical protein|nr:hypothetical protein VTO7225_02288 [Vibrio toranzoniae]